MQFTVAQQCQSSCSHCPYALSLGRQPNCPGLLQDGALELESAELRFEMGPDGRPTKVDSKQQLPMMAIVAEVGQRLLV